MSKEVRPEQADGNHVRGGQNQQHCKPKDNEVAAYVPTKLRCYKSGNNQVKNNRESLAKRTITSF